jgi:hypothetical protein
MSKTRTVRLVLSKGKPAENGKLYSINEAILANHSSIKLLPNGDKVIDVVIFDSDTPNEKNGQDVSVKCNSTQEKRDSEPAIYIGNGWKK